ncbi:MAG: hypothetical protein WAM01_02955 [Candidatus Acidiferrales bacterium]
MYTNSDGSYSVDTNSSPKECAQTQGNWVPPGYQYAVDSNGNVSYGFIQDQLNEYNSCVNQDTLPMAGIGGTANPNSSSAVNLGLGAAATRAMCSSLYPVAALSNQYTGPTWNLIWGS